MCYKFQLSITLGRISINSTQVTWVQDLTLWMILIQKKLSISPNCFIALKFISLVQLMLVHGMRTGVRQCLQVSERDRKGSEVKWVMAG